MQMNDDKKALEVLQKVEQVDPNNVKMLWRSGRALLNLGEFKDSEKYLVKARELDEGSGVIKKDLAKVRMLLEQEEAKKRELYAKVQKFSLACSTDHFFSSIFHPFFSRVQTRG